ncbi:rhomboid family intramembrane serine protease [Spirabiliibacterium falconis]|uniref:rhomboid family intramembrane serine protease n=1 Tax=Spirabiliibacterium falconis TaxID=572023 RepID=UPI001AACF922|nr:rhomboid family intramembrane serine protease [Spirabiliibacterium falconis]MBE2894466.1 rhomboid family intramembrane serine protease [Spirabiliibacterium falconis]
MHHVLSTDSHELALRFRDYAKLQFGITLDVIGGQPHFDVVCDVPLNDALASQLHEAVQSFIHNPHAPQFVQASWTQGQTDEPTALSLFSIPSIIDELRRAPLTLLITALCLVVYALQFLLGNVVVFNALHYPDTATQYHEIWRFISHALVHLSFSHLAFNLTWWFIFASRIEQKCGSWKILQLFLSCACLSGIVQNGISGAAFFGLSGVVYGVLGYIYTLHRLDPQHRFTLPTGFVYMIVVGIVIGFAAPLYGIQVGNAAHISGLVIGILSGWLDCKRAEKS